MSEIEENKYRFSHQELRRKFNETVKFQESNLLNFLKITIKVK